MAAAKRLIQFDSKGIKGDQKGRTGESMLVSSCSIFSDNTSLDKPVYQKPNVDPTFKNQFNVN